MIKRLRSRRLEVERRWLEESDDGAGVGFDPTGWERATWILHAMYESIDGADTQTYDEAERDAIARGDLEPLVVNSVDLTQRTTTTGVPLGMAGHPGARWRRLTWHGLADRLDIDLSAQSGWPRSAWFGSGSWSVSIQPPCEGSLDAESYRRLIELLAGWLPDGLESDVHLLHVPTSWWGPGEWHRRERLGSASTFGGPDQWFSPSNIWPADRSWFVYTDYDLCATKVSGSASLIDALVADPTLETLDWQPT